MTLQTEPKPVTYDTGEVVRCKLTVEIEATEQLVDPSGLTFFARLKDGTEITYVFGVDAQLVRDSAGLYHVDVDSSGGNGPVFYRFKGTGVNAGANDHSYNVAKTPATVTGV